MIAALDPADGRALYERGFQVLMMSATSLLATAARDFLEQIGRSS